MSFGISISQAAQFAFYTNSSVIAAIHAVGESSEWSVRAGLMNQSVDDGDVPAIEVTPDTDAIILNAGYSFFW